MPLAARCLAVAEHVFLQLRIPRIQLQGQHLDPHRLLVAAAGVIGLGQRIDEAGFFPLGYFDRLTSVLEAACGSRHLRSSQVA